jgi:hypothetical protein
MVEQMLEIPGFDGLGQSNQAFIIAHRGDVVCGDWGHRVSGIGLGDWHRSPLTNPARSSFAVEQVVLRPGAQCGGPPDRALTHRHVIPEKRTNHERRAGLTAS